MKNIKILFIALICQVSVSAQIPDTVFSGISLKGVFISSGYGQCAFQFDSTVIWKQIFNPHRFYGVNYTYESSYFVGVEGQYSIEYPTVVHSWKSMNVDATYKSDTVDIDGYIWKRSDAVDVGKFSKKKYKDGDIDINSVDGNETKIVCGCYTKIRRSKIHIDIIEPVQIQYVQAELKISTRA